MAHLCRSRCLHARFGSRKPFTPLYAQITSRVEEIRREILQIREANRIYKGRVAHTKEQISKHEERQRRLREIMVELSVLSAVPQRNDSLVS